MPHQSSLRATTGHWAWPRAQFQGLEGGAKPAHYCVSRVRKTQSFQHGVRHHRRTQDLSGRCRATSPNLPGNTRPCQGITTPPGRAPMCWGRSHRPMTCCVESFLMDAEPLERLMRSSSQTHVRVAVPREIPRSIKAMSPDQFAVIRLREHDSARKTV
jgi:hypothetical protein